MSKYLLARVIEGTDKWFNHVINDDGKHDFISKDNDRVCITAPCTQEGYNSLYELGKYLWDINMCSKFEIAAFDNGRLFWKTRPDMWNFEKNSYKSSFDKMIGEEYQSFSSDDFQNDTLEMDYVRDYQRQFWKGKTDTYTVDAFKSLICDSQLHDDLKVVQKLLDGQAEHNEKIGFEFRGVRIVNPFYDETLRFSVEPFSYYGEENVKKFVEQTIAFNVYQKKQKENHESLEDKIVAAKDKKLAINIDNNNEYYKTSDGFFDYYVNCKTGKKKFRLDKNDVCVDRKLDDFSR